MAERLAAPVELEADAVEAVEGVVDTGDQALLEQDAAVDKGRLFGSRARVLAIGVASVCAVLGLVLLTRGGAFQRLAPPVASAGGLVALDEVSDRQVILANCILNVDVAAAFMANAGVHIKKATEDCAVMFTQNDRTICASDITTVIASLGWVSSYIAAAVTTCGNPDTIGDECAASASALLADLGEYAFVASAVVRQCDGNETYPEQPEFRPLPDPRGRHLQKFNAPKPTKPFGMTPLKNFFDVHAAKLKEQADKMRLSKEPYAEHREEDLSDQRAENIARCVVDFQIGLAYVARAGTQMYWLAQDCPQQDPDNRKKCAVDIFNVVATLVWSAQWLSQTAAECPAIGNKAATCFAIIADFVATTASMGPVVNSITDNCQPFITGDGERSWTTSASSAGSLLAHRRRRHSPPRS